MAHLKKVASGHLAKSSGKLVKDCNCCCGCVGICYEITISGGSDTCVGCGTYDGDIVFKLSGLDCLGAQTFERLDSSSQTALIVLYPDSINLFSISLGSGDPCSDPFTDYEGGVAGSGGYCDFIGTHTLSPIGPSECSTDITVTVVEVACCLCPSACWKFTIEAVTPYVGSCLECESWNYPVEYILNSPLYTCLGPCTDDDYGFPVSFCYDGSGNVYIRASLETAPPCVCGECPFYIPYAMATALTLDSNGCPVDGTYTLSYDGPTIDYPDDPCEIPEINVTIEQISCCALNDETTPNYYISFDYEFHSYYSIDGDAVDCDGNPYGVNQCNVVNSETDMLMVASGGSTLWLDNGAWSPVVDCGSYSDVVSINCAGDGEWDLTFELIYNATTTKIGGLTPAGTYPDINICFNDGTISYRLDVINIVVTL